MNLCGLNRQQTSCLLFTQISNLNPPVTPKSLRHRHTGAGDRRHKRDWWITKLPLSGTINREEREARHIYVAIYGWSLRPIGYPKATKLWRSYLYPTYVCHRDWTVVLCTVCVPLGHTKRCRKTNDKPHCL